MIFGLQSRVHSALQGALSEIYITIRLPFLIHAFLDCSDIMNNSSCYLISHKIGIHATVYIFLVGYCYWLQVRGVMFRGQYHACFY